MLPALWAEKDAVLTACTLAAGISNNAASWSMIALIAVTSEPSLVVEHDLHEGRAGRFRQHGVVGHRLFVEPPGIRQSQVLYGLLDTFPQANLCCKAVEALIPTTAEAVLFIAARPTLPCRQTVPGLRWCSVVGWTHHVG